MAIFRELRVPDLPGKPTMGECCDKFVLDFVACIFGAYDHEGVMGDPGRQLIREFGLLIRRRIRKAR